MDKKKLAAKLKELNNPRKGGRKTYRVPDNAVDKTTAAMLRLVNYPFTEEEDPFPELWFHYGIKGGSILCPRNNSGNDCPVCSFAQDVYNKGTEKDQKLAKTLWPRKRAFAVVVDRAEDKPTPKYWGFGTTIQKKLIGNLLDPETEHFMDLETGIDLKVWKATSEGQDYASTDVDLARSESVLAETAEERQELMDAIIPLGEVYKPITESEIADRLRDWLSWKEGDKSAEESSSETTRGKVSSSKEILAELEAATEDSPETSEDYDVEAELESALAEANTEAS